MLRGLIVLIILLSSSARAETPLAEASDGEVKEKEAGEKCYRVMIYPPDKVKAEKPKPKRITNGTQEWGMGVSYTTHCQYTITEGDDRCPYQSWGLMGFMISKKYPLLFSGGTMVSNPNRWEDKSGKKQKRTLIDVHIEGGYRFPLWERRSGDVLTTIKLEAGASFGMKLRLFLDVTTYDVFVLSADLPDPKGKLMPYGQVWFLAGVSHGFLLLSADVGGTLAMNISFGFGF